VEPEERRTKHAALYRFARSSATTLPSAAAGSVGRLVNKAIGRTVVTRLWRRWGEVGRSVASVTRVAASITISLDGYITGPNDGPGRGLGDGGERLHSWVFGGPWSYDDEPRGEATEADKQYLDEAMARSGAVVVGRNMYEAAEVWGGHNPFGVLRFVVTHRAEDEPAGGFTFVNGLDEAIARAREAAAGNDVGIGGGAE
jgi:dihydrofolate reductase